jgi:hypothetical protein
MWVRRDGSRVALPLDESGMIPQRLGAPRAEIAFVDVTLTSDHLRTLTVVDTPGLSSTTTSVSEEARRALLGEDLDDDSVGALCGAEAIVYVFTQAVREDDLQALEAFRAISARLASNPINSLGLFNKVDKLVGGAADPWPVAGPPAAGQTRVLRRVVSDVVPVVGLLAETTEAGRLTAADCEALRALAQLGVAERTVLLAAVDLFTTRDCPVPAPQRERLLRRSTCTGSASPSPSLPRGPGWPAATWSGCCTRRPGSPGCGAFWTRRSACAPTPSRRAGRCPHCRSWPGTPSGRPTGSCCATPSSGCCASRSTTGCG